MGCFGSVKKGYIFFKIMSASVCENVVPVGKSNVLAGFVVMVALLLYCLLVSLCLTKKIDRLLTFY